MNKKPLHDNIIVGLDIGTATVSALVGQLFPDGDIKVIGTGNSPTTGMNKGSVNDLQSVVKSIKQATYQAQLTSDHPISNVFLSISGYHISGKAERGMGTISGKTVSQEDVDYTIHTARSIKIGDERKILHVIPQEFTIDGQGGIKNPLGLPGVRMEVSVYLISCHNHLARNIIKAVERCGFKVNHLVYSGLAASYAVLTREERELGVCIVDIGAGTMDVAVWTGGALRHTEVFSYAGNSVTDDIAFAFGTSTSDAEEMKLSFGCAVRDPVIKDDAVGTSTIRDPSSRSIQRETLSEVIEPRYTELMLLVERAINSMQEKLRSEGIRYNLSAGVVLTGGGAKMKGLSKCAERVFRGQVRVGKPLLGMSVPNGYSGGLHQSTAFGLLLYARDNQINDIGWSMTKPESRSLSDVFSRLRNWIKKEF